MWPDLTEERIVQPKGWNYQELRVELGQVVNKGVEVDSERELRTEKGETRT